jgi:hypothetical protein
MGRGIAESQFATTSVEGYKAEKSQVYWVILSLANDLLFYRLKDLLQGAARRGQREIKRHFSRNRAWDAEIVAVPINLYRGCMSFRKHADFVFTPAEREHFRADQVHFTEARRLPYMLCLWLFNLFRSPNPQLIVIWVDSWWLELSVQRQVFGCPGFGQEKRAWLLKNDSQAPSDKGSFAGHVAFEPCALKKEAILIPERGIRWDMVRENLNDEFRIWKKIPNPNLRLKWGGRASVFGAAEGGQIAKNVKPR